MYQNPFRMKIHFQSQYTCIFMLKVRTHVQFHWVSQTRAMTKTLKKNINTRFWISQCAQKSAAFGRNRTGASPGTFCTVSGTARMVPAEDPKVEHIGTKQCVVDWLYIESMFFKSSGRSLDGVLRYLLNWFGNSKSYCSLDINPILQSNKSSSFTNIQNHLQWNFSEGCLSDNTIVNAKHGA